MTKSPSDNTFVFLKRPFLFKKCLHDKRSLQTGTSPKERLDNASMTTFGRKHGIDICSVPDVELEIYDRLAIG